LIKKLIGESKKRIEKTANARCCGVGLMVWPEVRAIGFLASTLCKLAADFSNLLTT
jgi:hypothetical protein